MFFQTWFFVVQGNAACFWRQKETLVSWNKPEIFEVQNMFFWVETVDKQFGLLLWVV